MQILSWEEISYLYLQDSCRIRSNTNEIDPAHQEEREVMHHPAQKELPASLQQDLGQPWAPSSTARSADREGAESLV